VGGDRDAGELVSSAARHSCRSNHGASVRIRTSLGARGARQAANRVFLDFRLGSPRLDLCMICQCA
jgi:hypothetical protein